MDELWLKSWGQAPRKAHFSRGLRFSQPVTLSWAQRSYRQDIDTILASVRNSGFSNNDGKRRRRIVLENGRNLFQIGCGLIGIIGVKLDFKRTPRAVVKLDDGVDFPAVVVLIMVKLRVDGFCIYLKITPLDLSAFVYTCFYP